MGGACVRCVEKMCGDIVLGIQNKQTKCRVIRRQKPLNWSVESSIGLPIYAITMTPGDTAIAQNPHYHLPRPTTKPAQSCWTSCSRPSPSDRRETRRISDREIRCTVWWSAPADARRPHCRAASMCRRDDPCAPCAGSERSADRATHWWRIPGQRCPCQWPPARRQLWWHLGGRSQVRKWLSESGVGELLRWIVKLLNKRIKSGVQSITNYVHIYDPLAKHVYNIFGRTQRSPTHNGDSRVVVLRCRTCRTCRRHCNRRGEPIGVEVFCWAHRNSVINCYYTVAWRAVLGDFAHRVGHSQLT